MVKRLFLFASYDQDAVIDDYVVYYVRALAELGDVIFFMDSDASPEELDKVRPYTIYARAERHRSYDFGSYKRLYQWADAQGILGNYDFLYLCNDSCFGPFLPLGPALENMEVKGADWFGFVAGTWRGIHHIQSWFVGMRAQVFLADWWKLFVEHITQESDKDAYINKYEFFMSRLAEIYGASFFSFLDTVNILAECDRRLADGMPFIKRLGYFQEAASWKGFFSRKRALLMLEPQQRAMVMRYMHRISPMTAWLVMHPVVHTLIYSVQQSLKAVLGITRKDQDLLVRPLGLITLLKIGPSKRKAFAVRVLGIPVFYKRRTT